MDKANLFYVSPHLATIQQFFCLSSVSCGFAVPGFSQHADICSTRSPQLTLLGVVGLQMLLHIQLACGVSSSSDQSMVPLGEENYKVNSISLWVSPLDSGGNHTIQWFYQLVGFKFLRSEQYSLVPMRGRFRGKSYYTKLMVKVNSISLWVSISSDQYSLV